MAKRASVAIAESIGFDAAEMSEYRYQRYTAPAIYSIGERYFAAHPNKPAHMEDFGIQWVKYSDQFGARGTNLTIWVNDNSNQ